VPWKQRKALDERRDSRAGFVLARLRLFCLLSTSKRATPIKHAACQNEENGNFACLLLKNEAFLEAHKTIARGEIRIGSGRGETEDDE
jgi:hypothetical protein